MGKIKNLTGQKFGDLTVKNFVFLDKFNKASWECICDCGNSIILTSESLKKYHYCKKCGVNWRKSKLVGKKFGSITVLSLLDGLDKNKNALWKCLCDCGNELILNTSILKRKYNFCEKCKTISKKLDLTGLKFGNITVISFTNKRDKNGELLWNCICDCGESLILNSSKVKNIKQKHCIICKRKNRIKNLTGKKKGSITVISFAILGKFGNARWNCICDCGNKFVLDSHSIDKIKNNSRCNKCVKHCYSDETLSSKKQLYLAYKKKCAELRGISFSLKFDDFINLTQQNCFYCGAPPSNFKKSSGARQGIFYNGLDRIDNKKGYSLDNVNPCCMDCNYAKGTQTKKEFIDWIQKCYNHIDSKDFK